MSATIYNYSLQTILDFMLATYHDHVDGYNRLDKDALLQAALTEYRHNGDSSVAPDFEIAANAVAKQHKDNGGNL